MTTQQRLLMESVLKAAREAGARTPLEIYRATGYLVPIAGGATPQGYNETADLLIRTIDGVDLDVLWQEFIDTVNLLNKQRDPLIARLTFTVEEAFEQVPQIVEADFEEADEFGQPKGIRLAAPWNMGFPLKYFDLGIRYTYRFLGRAPSNQIRALNNNALEADNRLMYKTILTRLFRNVRDTATLEDTGTPVTVWGLYNGSTQTLPTAPPAWKSYVHTTSHEHYLTSGNAAVTSANLDAMELHIYHHGYEQGADLILLVNRQEALRIAKFRVTAGDLYDFIPAAGSNWENFYGTFVGRLPATDEGENNAFYPGFIGTYGPWDVVMEDMMPAGYMVGFASGGAYALGNLIGIREHEHPDLRGLKLIPQFDRYPLRESFYHHALGAGVRIPGAGVVMQVTAGSYAVPTLVTGGPGGR